MGIGSFFEEAWKTATDSVKSAYSSVKDKVIDMFEATKNTVVNLGEAGVNIVSGGAELVKQGVEKGSEVVSTVYNDAKGIINKGLDTFSSPLLWAALGIGGAAILMRK